MTGTESRPYRALLIDDDAAVRGLIAECLILEGMEPIQAPDGAAGLELLRRGTVDVVLLDMNMPGRNGLEVLKEARTIEGCPPVIMVTGQSAISTAVQAAKSGAYDYVTKPVNIDELILTIRRALESCQLQRENQRLRKQVASEQTLHEQMGHSDAIKRLIAEVERVATTDFTVVVSGETGSGKELVARAIHQLSNRSRGPFIAVDSGAIQPGLIESDLFGHEKGSFTGADRPRPGRFEAAAGGTIFLDEVQNLSMATQIKFLRAIQERQIYRVGSSKPIDINIRIVAASNKNLLALVAAGEFREDLYHRLNEFMVSVPPLRERPEDIVYLTSRFVTQVSTELGKEPPRLTPEVIALLQEQRWPGNVRELRNVIRRAVLLADGVIQPMHLGFKPTAPAAVPAAPPVAPLAPGTPVAAVPARPAALPDVGELDGQTPLKEFVRRHVAQIESEVIAQAMKQCGGNKAKAARLLQIDYKTMQSKAREYGFAPANEQPANAE